MILPSTQSRKRGEQGQVGIFDLLCFVAAAALIYPSALWVSHHFTGFWSEVIFYAIMFIVYPVVGFLFLIAFWSFVAFCRKRSHKNKD
jgi:hypothetical protein